MTVERSLRFPYAALWSSNEWTRCNENWFMERFEANVQQCSQKRSYVTRTIFDLISYHTACLKSLQ